MKSTLPLLLTLLAFNLFAQKYAPFPEDSAYWIRKVEHAGGFGGAPFCERNGTTNYVYYAFEDTLINGKDYRLVKESLISDYEYGPDANYYINNDFDTVLKNGKTSFCFRNDSINKTVYAIKLSEIAFDSYNIKEIGEEFIWYDFNLELEDSLGNHTTYFQNTHLVDSIDSVEYCGTYRKRYLTKNNGMLNGEWAELIEGVGIGLGFMEDNHDYYFEPCSFPNVTLYQKGCENFMQELSTLTSTKESPNFISLDIYPNPADNIINFSSELPLDIQLFDLNGRLVFRKENVTKQVNISQLNPGSYIISAHTMNNQISHSKIIIK